VDSSTTTSTSRGNNSTQAEDLVGRYLREVRSAPILERDEETRYANELIRSREEFARLVLELDDPMRCKILDGNLDGPRRGRRWSLEQLEACYERMKECDLPDEPDRTTSIFNEALSHKRTLDRSREALVTSHLRFVAHVVRQYSFLKIPFLDLVQEGNLGLLKALERFDPAKGYRFATYAYWWIRQAITRATVDKGRLIRLPEHVQARISRARGAFRELRESLQRRPTENEIAEKLKLPLKKVEELGRYVQDPDPLEDHGDDQEPGGRLRTVEDSTAPSPLESALQLERRKQVHEAINHSLTPREQAVIRMRFGLDGAATMTLQETGAELNLSRERIRQIERAAFGKIHAWHTTQHEKEIAGLAGLTAQQQSIAV
jgi:RNA polymerase sigma factor (sigma-70 family)